MAREGLRASLNSAIRIARQTRRHATRSARCTRDEETVEVEINVYPVMVEAVELLLVTFTDLPSIAKASSSSPGPPLEPGHVMVERELESVRLELQNTVRDFERSSEELRAVNEGAMSMNEKFQSTNEELEASKEEL